MAEEEYLELTVDLVNIDVETYTGQAAETGLPFTKAGYMRFIIGLDDSIGIAHLWSFLQPMGTLYLWPDITTGAVTVGGAGNKTLTVAADTFYQSMEGHAIVADTSGTSYTIDGYTDAKNITVTADASADTGDTFTITADGIYRMPDNFQALIDRPVYTYSSTLDTPGITEKDPEQIFDRWRVDDDTDDPVEYAIVPVIYAKTVRHCHDMIVAPVPDALRTWRYRYRRAVVDITDAAEYFAGGELHSYTIRQCALADAEMRTGRTVGVMEKLAQLYMARSIAADKGLFVSDDVERLQHGA